MADEMMVKELEEVVVRFSGDSGDGMQLAGNIFSNVSATVGNDICTFPDYPADIRAPQGSLTGVSGFQVHVGASKIFTPGDHCHVLVAMNPAALKTQIKFCKPQGLVLTDSDSFGEKIWKKHSLKQATLLKSWESNNKCSKCPSHRCARRASKTPDWTTKPCCVAKICSPSD